MTKKEKIIQLLNDLNSKMDLLLEGKPDNEYLTINEAAEFLKISMSEIYKMTSSREIDFIKNGKRMLIFRKSDLVKWFESHSVRSVDSVIGISDKINAIQENIEPRTIPTIKNRTQKGKE